MDMVEILNPGQYTRRAPNVTDGLRRINGTLPSYSDVGCYPIMYLTQQNNVLCAECATKAVDVPDPAFEYDAVAAYDAYWEGDPMACDECGKDIESAYGPVDVSE